MKGDRMEKGLKGYRPLLLLLLCGGMTLKAAAQAAITDPLNTAQSTLTAGNTAATVKQVTESVNRLQTALDYVQKVSATVRRARMFTDSGRIKHLRKCLEKLREQEAGLSAIRQTISRTRTIRRNLGLVTK